LSHDDSSFVGASDVSQFSVQYNTYFGRARLRSDARRVQGQTTWVRPRQDPEVATRHSVPHHRSAVRTAFLCRRLVYRTLRASLRL